MQDNLRTLISDFSEAKYHTPNSPLAVIRYPSFPSLTREHAQADVSSHHPDYVVDIIAAR